MASGTSVLLLLAACVVGQALTPSTYLTTIDKQRLRSVFEAAQPYSDAANAHYSIMGLKLLGLPIPKQQEACKAITSGLDAGNVESLFHTAVASKGLENCKVSLGNGKQLLTDTLKEGSTVADIFYAFFALKNFGLAVDDKKVSEVLLAALKKEDSPVSMGYAFHVASQLSGDLTKFFENIEDVVAQADEVNEQFLQFEGGLYVTALVVDGAYKLAEKAKKPPTITEDKAVKFANYFLSRKHVHQLRGAYQFLSVIRTLTDNKYQIPIAVTLASSVSVSQSKNQVQVRVTDLLGGSLGKLTVTADSARHHVDDAVVLSKKPFTAAKSDNSLYELNFMDVKPARGFYTLALSVTPQKADTRLIGIKGAELTVKVITKVEIKNVELGVVDRDQSTAPRTVPVKYPNKADKLLEADYHQKLVMRFQLADQSTSKLISVHQMFVRLENQKTKQEIIFVAEPDSTLTNKFDLDIGSNGKEFGYLSGKYSMELIIGDLAVENPFRWIVADVSLTFPEGSAPEQSEGNQYAEKPAIVHQFRVPEKRPPKTVSTAFTGLVLVPLVILLALWMKIGVNVSNFPISISAIGFHVCLAAIFGLYYLYWTQLNMFLTLRYLGILALPTFLFGNRLLSGIAARRK